MERQSGTKFPALYLWELFRKNICLTAIILSVLALSFLSTLNAGTSKSEAGFTGNTACHALNEENICPEPAAVNLTEKSTFSAGVAKINITPSTPVIMAGYSGRPDPFKGVHDSLFAVATVFDDGAAKAVIIAADVIGFSHDSWDKITKKIEKETGIPQKFILLSPNHTHGGPATGRYGEDPDNDLAAYNRELNNKLVTVTKEALGRLQPALIGSGKGICKMSINRRALNSSTKGLRIGKNPYGPVDHEVGVVRIDNQEGKVFSLFVNWPTHATVMGRENYMITADWPGATRRHIEREFNGPVIASVTAGASGDINPLYRERPTFSDGELEETGIILGREVVRVANEINTYPAVSINALQRVITLPGKMPGGSWLPRDSFDPGPDIDVRLSLLRVGNIIFAGISGEVFSEIGMKIKELSPYKSTHIITHCNGASGYLITDSAYPEGGYEVFATRVMAGAEQGIINNFIEMINDI